MLRFFSLISSFLNSKYLEKIIHSFSSVDFFKYENCYEDYLKHYLYNSISVFWFSEFLIEFHPFLIQNTWKIQSILDTQRWKKYIIVTVYSTIYCRAWDLWTFQSEFDHHRKKNIFASSYSTNMVHGAMEKFNRYLTSSEKEIFSFLAKARKCSTKVLATIVHVTWKNSIGYRPQRKQIFLYLASQNSVAVYRGYNGPPYSVQN